MLYQIATSVLVIHYFFDTHYVLRTLTNGFCSKFFGRKLKPMDSSCIYGICTTTDVDLNLNHMNNARILREFDFGRMDHGIRLKIFWDTFRKGGAIVVGGATVRYRLPVPIFSLYKVVTTPVWWDEKTIFYDQQLITLSDGIVRAAAYNKLVVTKVNLEEYFKERQWDVTKPSADSLPEDIKKWQESQAISRENMKRERERENEQK